MLKLKKRDMKQFSVINHWLAVRAPHSRGFWSNVKRFLLADRDPSAAKAADAV